MAVGISFSPAALGDHPRNKSDEAIKALAKKGRVIGLSPWSEHISKRLNRRPTMKDFMDLIDYVVNLAGVDHVGYGLDLAPQMPKELYDSYNKMWPEMFKDRWEDRNFLGLTDYDCVIDITRGLVDRGYSDEDIKKINGGNFIRLFEKTWHNPPKIPRTEDEKRMIGGS
jgi:membrane dipeptidase